MRNEFRAPLPSYTVTADHALRALLLIARSEGAPVPARRIAAALGAPPNYIGKTLNTLAHAGLLYSRRGATGGFSLRVSPSALTVAAVMDVFADPRPDPPCLVARRRCEAATACAMHERWSSLLSEARRPFEHTTLQSLLPPA